ncbi:hypothetical protein Tco_0179206 [Tanacetum coccineum]
MTKVIKGEFEKLKDVKVEDVSLTYDTSLEVFNDEFNRLNGMNDDLFTYEVEIAKSNMNDDSEDEADDDMGYDPSDVAFTEWLGSKNFNYKTMDHYTMKALWIYWIRGNDEVELTDEESSDNEDEVAEVFRIDTNIWREDGFCNGGNFPDAYVIGNSLHYQDLEWYEALEDSELKEEALRNKAIMEGLIEEEDDNDESRYEQRRRWNVYTNYDDAYEINHDVAEREELCEIHELPVCNIRSFEMIKYSFGQDEEYVAIKEYEYDDLARTSEDAYQAYQEIFRMIDEGWMVTRAE